MADSNWLMQFPAMERADLVGLRKSLDSTYREFTRNYGDMIESFFDPLLYFLVWFEKFLLFAPWPIILAILIGLTYAASRAWKLSLGGFAAFFLIGYFGMWGDTMRTLAIITVATLLSIGLGVPIGIAMARSDRVQTLVTPILDIMQTMPAFVYLIPVVMLLGIGKVPGILAVLVYAIPPVIRLTNLGIRMVDKDVLEAAIAFGATQRQRLLEIQLPLALPTINDIDGPRQGRYRFDERRERIGAAGTESHYQPVFHDGTSERSRHRGNRHCLRPRKSGLCKTEPKTP